MKKLCLSIALFAAALPVLSATSVGVSIGIDQPGVYGRIDIGRVPVAPVLVYPSPVVIVASPVSQVQRPIYLHVPPGHAKDWRRHCDRYGACNRPVYFVQEDWYRKQYHATHTHKRHKHDRDDDHDRGRGKKGKGHGRDKD